MGSNHKVKYSSGKADDTLYERAFCERVDPRLHQKQSPDNWSSRGPGESQSACGTLDRGATQLLLEGKMWDSTLCTPCA